MTKAAELAKIGEVLTNSQIGGRRNIVINGAMQLAQRATSATNPGGGYNSLDRYRFTQNSSGLGNFTAEQSTDVPSGEGFKSSLKMTNGDAKTITTTMTCYIETKFEGQDVQQLKYGTSSAENVTLSFFVRSSVTGTFCCHLFQEGNNKAHVKEYTISSANTFEKKTLTFTGDTATSLANDNTAELNIGWVLGSGSDAQISADSWASVPSAKGYCTSNQTNWITTNGATFYITGVQLEVGEQATPFEHRSFGEELLLCQRYFQDIAFTGTNLFTLNPLTGSANRVPMPQLSPPMRLAPSFTFRDSSNNTGFLSEFSAGTQTSITSLAGGTITGIGTGIGGGYLNLGRSLSNPISMCFKADAEL